MAAVREDAGTALLHALAAAFAPFAGAYRVDELVSRSWASVTFSGARHRVVFSLEGAGAARAADAFIAEMREAEFALPGHILADIVLTGEERSADGQRIQVRLEALTVEDD